jgi:hypothetical protein
MITRDHFERRSGGEHLSLGAALQFLWRPMPLTDGVIRILRIFSLHIRRGCTR